MSTELKQIIVDGEKFFVSFSFDIDDFIGDGVWWLQVFDEGKNVIYDKPFANSMGKTDMKKIRKIVIQEFLTCKGAILL